MIQFYVDQRYLMDIKDEPAHELDLGQRANKVINTMEYTYNRNKYANQSPYSTPQYQQPWFYFWAVDNKLRILGTNLELDMTKECSSHQQEKIMNVLGSDWSIEALSGIYNYLREQSFSEYYKALLAFKWAAKLLPFPLFDLYDQIQMIDGKLFGWLPCSRGQYAPYAWQLLTDEVVLREIRRCKGVNEVSHNKKISLTKSLVRLHKNDLYAEKGSWEKKLAVRYREGLLEYVPTLGHARFSAEGTANIHPLLSMGGTPRSLQYSEALERSLLDLTNGELDKLDLLADLFARIFCRTISSKYLWHIHGNSKTFFLWLYNLTGGCMNDTIYTTSDDRFETNIVYDQTSRLCVLCNKYFLSAEQFASLNHSRLRRYIEGGEIINIEDPYQLEKTAHYYPVVMFFSEGTSIDSNKAFKKLQRMELCIPDNWSLPKLSVEDTQWLKTCFVARGLQLIHGIERRQEEQVSVEQVVHQFSDAFCESDSNNWTNCKAFYKALKSYISTLPYEVPLEGSSITSANIEKWMNWRRKEERKDNNRMVFHGIRLNMGKLNEAMAENRARQEQEKRARALRDFHEYLNEINELVLWLPTAP